MTYTSITAEYMRVHEKRALTRVNHKPDLIQHTASDLLIARCLALLPKHIKSVKRCANRPSVQPDHMIIETD